MSRKIQFLPKVTSEAAALTPGASPLPPARGGLGHLQANAGREAPRGTDAVAAPKEAEHRPANRIRNAQLVKKGHGVAISDGGLALWAGISPTDETFKKQRAPCAAPGITLEASPLRPP